MILILSSTLKSGHRSLILHPFVLGLTKITFSLDQVIPTRDPVWVALSLILIRRLHRRLYILGFNLRNFKRTTSYLIKIVHESTKMLICSKYIFYIIVSVMTFDDEISDLF